MTLVLLLEKPMFKGAIRHKRCVILADGFYEPKGPSGAKNRPWYVFQFKDQRVFGFAGIWIDDGFAIITAEPNKQVSSIHNRMPLILKPTLADRWLDPNLKDDTELSHLLEPWEYRGMENWEVSNYVKSAKNQGAKCIEKI